MSKSTETPDDQDLQKQQRRLREIFDARKQVAERKQRAFELLATNQLSYELASRFFGEAVETYLIESEQVIKSYLPADVASPDELADDRAELAYDVWYTADLGEMELSDGTRSFSGLHEYLAVDGTVTEAWQERDERYIGGGGVTTKTREHQVPLHISKRAWRVCNYFWAEVGMDFDPPEDEDREGEFTIDMIEN